MNKIAKIVLVASLAALFGCSGDGNVKSRINNAEDGAPVDAPSNSGSDSGIIEEGPAGNGGNSNGDNANKGISCMVKDASLKMCAQGKTNRDLTEDDCEDMGGKVVKSCESGYSDKCDTDEGSIYLYGSSFSCEDFED
ncbi:MAG: hypothetical protein MJZ26_13465 [Fibrobacter sp.]|nr:hypothetical protein [Fibrobacter sp.]